MIEKRLFHFAADANPDNPGMLDAPSRNFKRKREGLKSVRKITIGRHRVYYTGHYKQCSYKTIYVKQFKKSGVNDEDDKNFQNKLRKAIILKSERQIETKKIKEGCC